MNIIQTFFSRQFLWELIRIVVVGVATLLFYLNLIPLRVLVGAMAFGSYALVKTAFYELLFKRKVDTELFIVIAVIVSIMGSEYLAGAMVLMIILIAEYIASASGERARASIKELIYSVPKTALVRNGTLEKMVLIEDLRVDDIVLVKAGDKIPVDGKIVSGSGSVNQAPITGESTPLERSVGDIVYTGTIVGLGAFDIQMTKAGKDTVFSHIISMVEEAENNRAPIEKYTDKVASYLIPLVLVFVVAVYLITKDVKLVIALLIFTSPAELGLATPLVTIATIARSAREGILIKGGLFLEELAATSTVVFDKTGTLTIGSPQVNRIDVVDDLYDENQLVALAATANRRSSHPLAKAILSYVNQKKIAFGEPDSFEVIKGRGVTATVNDKTVLIGNKLHMTENGIVSDFSFKSTTDTVVYVSVDHKLRGVFYISDTIRDGAKAMIEELRGGGVKNIIMLTGDNPRTAQHVAEQVGISEYMADLLPEDKIEAIKALQQSGEKVAMVGDGINDAPALAQANIGIAMGGMGTESAMEAADIVLMDDKLYKITQARAISKRALKTIKENIFVGVGMVHVIGITLVLLKLLSPVQAAAIHLLPDTLVFLNSIKLLRVKI